MVRATTGVIAFDAVNNATTVKRAIGSASFSGQATVNSSYSLSGVNSKVAVAGIAFTGGEPAEPPPPT